MLSPTDRQWLWLAAACYLAGLIMGTVSVLRERRHSRGRMYLVVAAGFVIQTFGLYLRGLVVGGCPLGNTFEIFQFTAWSATALFLVVGPTFRVSLLGYFTSCLAAVLTIASLLTPSWDATRRAGLFGGNPWVEFHAALALFSYGVFALLALTSGMYLLQVYSLKHKHLSGFFSFLPSILDLDHISLRLLSAGVALLAASLAVGSVYWIEDTATVDTAKIIATVSVWVAYALTLGLRATSLVVGKRQAWICVVLFAAALLSLGPVNSSRHSVASTADLIQSPATTP